MRREKVILVAGSARHEITAEIADTASTRATGLMFRRQLSADAGMLFLYKPPQEVRMWMHNTYIPLDMVFIRGDGTIVNIAENAEPLSESVIPSGVPVAAVLELAGGVSRALGLKSGDRVLHAYFDNAGE